MKPFALLGFCLLATHSVARSEFRIITSPELRPLVEKLVAVYGKTVSISAPNGFIAERDLLKSPTALALVSSMPDAFGLAQLKSKGVNPSLHPFASEPLAWATHPANRGTIPENRLLEVLRQGRANWATFGGETTAIAVYAPAESTDFGDWLHQFTLDKSGYGATIRTYATMAEGLSRVRGDRNAAALVTATAVYRQSGIQAVLLANVTRTLQWAVPANPSRAIQPFLDSVQSESGQKVIKDFGLTPSAPNTKYVPIQRESL